MDKIFLLFLDKDYLDFWVFFSFVLKGGVMFKHMKMWAVLKKHP